MDSKKEIQHVYLVGAKSLGAYGGYETFVYKLTEYHQNKENIKYHVACKANGDGCMDESKFEGVTKINDHEFEFHNAHCFKIDVPQIGSAQAIYYDVAALKACCEHIKKNHIPHPIVYIMACRIGPFAGHFYREIHKLGGTVFLNPDGHEWMRAKWSAPIRKYWKISEQMMVKYCDLAICDSVNIEKYIHECYDGKGIKGSSPKTTFIAYGADLTLSKLADDDEKLVSWYKEKGLTKKGYYLVVGRFVPENSFEVMIREFMKSKSKKDFAIITNVNEKFLNELEEKLHFKSDKRIKFVGTVYDQELLKKIRENAYAYFHGHTVGGTNPSLIEALGSTDLNLLVDVGFNKEVAEDCALYWSRKPGSLAKLIDKADQMSADEIAEMGRKAKQRVAEEYTWDKICRQYDDVFVKVKMSFTPCSNRSVISLSWSARLSAIHALLFDFFDPSSFHLIRILVRHLRLSLAVPFQSSSMALTNISGSFERYAAFGVQNAAKPIQMSCRFVRLRKTLFFTLDRSFGIVT